MNAIVIEHVPVADLPQEWRDKLAQAAHARVTVGIETEHQPVAPADQSFVTPSLRHEPPRLSWRPIGVTPHQSKQQHQLIFNEPSATTSGSKKPEHVTGALVFAQHASRAQLTASQAADHLKSRSPLV
jgi:hypothetical protein